MEWVIPIKVSCVIKLNKTTPLKKYTFHKRASEVTWSSTEFFVFLVLFVIRASASPSRFTSLVITSHWVDGLEGNHFFKIRSTLAVFYTSARSVVVVANWPGWKRENLSRKLQLLSL